MINERVIAGIVCVVAEPIGPLRPHPLIFSHGMWEGPLVWRKYLRYFRRRGYRCYAPYLRGYHAKNQVPHGHVGKVWVSEYLGFAHMIPMERGWRRIAEDIHHWLDRELTKPRHP